MAANPRDLPHGAPSLALRLSHSEGGYRNTRLTALDLDFSALCGLLSKASVGPKDGSYFVRGPFSQPFRADSNLTHAEVVILDGDMRIDPDTGAIEDAGAPHPSLAHEALRDLGIPHAIFTTHSHQPNRFRWRAVIPCRCPDQETLQAVVDHLIDRLHQAGVYVANARENGNWSQPWFFPRIQSADAEFLAFSHEDDDPLTAEQVSAIVADWRKSRANQAPPLAATGHRASAYDPTTVIGRFIEAFDRPEYIGDLLEKHGYVFRHHAHLNGRPAYRFMWPGSTSGVPGVHLYAGQDNGRRLVYSHHPDDPLHGRVHDVFGVFQVLEHGDDSRKAVAAAAEWARQQDERGPDEQEPTRPKFRLTHVSELLKQPEPLKWLMRDYLLPESLALIFGEPESGKSLVILDWAAHIATGTPHHGNPVKQGCVVYLAGEGHHGIRRRLKAWTLANGIGLHDAPLVVSERGAKLTDEASLADVIESIDAAATAYGKPVLIVVDTLHRNFGDGDENSATDMGVFVHHLDRLRARYGAAIVTVHHCGHGDNKRSRGSSAIRGSLDIEYSANNSDGLITLACTKFKDAPKPDPAGYEIVPVTLPWLDSDGIEEVSVTVKQAAAAIGKAGGAGKRMPPSVRYGIGSLHQATRERGQDGAVHVDDWRPVFYSGHTADSTDAKKVAFQRVRKELIEGSAASAKDDRYSLLDGSQAVWADAHGYIQTLNLAKQGGQKCA